MNPTAAPFTCIHLPNLADILRQLNCLLAQDTYQAGKVAIIESHGKKRVSGYLTLKQ